VKLRAETFSFNYSMQAKFLWLAILTSTVLLALFSFKVIQGRAEVKAGQMPKPNIARQTFSTTEGKKFSLEASRGKVIMVQFFGTWCGHSKRQVSAINKLIEGGKSDELQVVGMSVKDSRSNSQAVKQFITDQKVSYPVIGEVDDKYFVDFIDSRDVSVPQTLIYGRDGRLLAHYRGYNQQVSAEIEQKLNAALAKE
jgi:thiol-disulfide isomerase/thioredoxin